MAIINKFEVAIESHGGNLPEYDDNNADQPEWIRSYYVQASPATRFSIRLTLAPGFAFYPPTDFLTAKIWIDGVRVNSLVLMKHKYCPWRGATVRKSAITVASGDITVKRLLVFGKLGTFEGDTLQNSNDLNSEYGQLGTIRVEVWRKVTICREKGHSPATTFTGKDSAPETALKGDSKSVSVQLGDVLGFQPIKHLRTGVRTRDEPDAIFSFKCRSLADLKAVHIVPPTPEPISLEDRPVEDLNEQEMRELLRRHRAERIAQTTQIKREARTNIRPKPLLKRERTSDREDQGEGAKVQIDGRGRT